MSGHACGPHRLTLKTPETYQTEPSGSHEVEISGKLQKQLMQQTAAWIVFLITRPSPQATHGHGVSFFFYIEAYRDGDGLTLHKT